MGFLESLLGLKRGRRGRPPKMPERETRPYPVLMQLGTRNNKWRYLYKPTPRWRYVHGFHLHHSVAERYASQELLNDLKREITGSLRDLGRRINHVFHPDRD
jgi:hypothetical protein